MLQTTRRCSDQGFCGCFNNSQPIDQIRGECISRANAIHDVRDIVSQNLSRENFHDIGAIFDCPQDFRDGPGSRQVRNLIARTQPSGFEIERRAHYESRSREDGDPRRFRIEHRSRAPQNSRRVFRQLLQHAMRTRHREGDLDAIQSAFGARVRGPHYGDHTGAGDSSQDFDLLDHDASRALD